MAIRGFYLARYRFVDVVGSERGRHDELIVAWDHGGASLRVR
jgi:hypothetical protein